MQDGAYYRFQKSDKAGVLWYELDPEGMEYGHFAWPHDHKPNLAEAVHAIEQANSEGGTPNGEGEHG